MKANDEEITKFLQNLVISQKERNLLEKVPVDKLIIQLRKNFGRVE